MSSSSVPQLSSNENAYQSIPDARENADQKSSNNEVYGYILMVGASFCLKVMALSTRTVTVYYDVSVQNMIFLRGSTLFFLGLISAFTLANPREVFNVPRSLYPLLALRGLFGAASLAILYWAISLLPLYLVTTLFFLNPFFTIVLSSVFLGERVTLPELCAAGVSLVGVVLVGKPSLDSTGMMRATNLLGAALAVVAAGIVSVAYVMIRALGKRIHFLASLLSFGFMVTTIGVLLGGAVLPGLTKGVILALAGCVVGFVGQVCVNLGFQHCRASTGTLLRTADVPFAYLLGLLFLGEVPQTLSFFGSALVIFGTITVGLVGRRKTDTELDSSKTSTRLIEIDIK